MEDLKKYKTILIQGAMDIEIEHIIKSLKDKKFRKIKEYKFYEGTINNKKVVVSKTYIGSIDATIATTIGIIEFNPTIVINQGIAGGHKKQLHTGDIVIGEKCCNINSYDMPIKEQHKGSNPFEWEPNKRAKDIKYANKELVALLEKNIKTNKKNSVYTGVLGSGDVFNREFDRITWITEKFDNLCEDMESIGVYTVCERFKIPCVGVRIISNNELLKEELNEEKAIELQQILIDII